MTTVYRGTFYALLLFNFILAMAVINLSFFANRGARFTAADGAKERLERIQEDTREREERMQADRDIIARIDNLHPHVCPTP